jgi:integrase
VKLEGAPPLPSISIHLRRTKTSGADDDEVVYLAGRPVDALNAWIKDGEICKGSIFRAIDRWGSVSRRSMDPKAINDILKHRVELAGLDPAEFSAHGLRSGYLTEAANRGIPLPEAMEQSVTDLCSRRRATTTTLTDAAVVRHGFSTDSASSKPVTNVIISKAGAGPNTVKLL